MTKGRKKKIVWRKLYTHIVLWRQACQEWYSASNFHLYKKTYTKSVRTFIQAKIIYTNFILTVQRRILCPSLCI